MTLTLTVGGVDQSGFTVYDITVATGRDDVYSQPDGSVMNAEFVGWVPAGKVGDEVVLTDEFGQVFRGWVTDVRAELQSDMTWRSNLSATGPLALLGQALAGYAAWPVESDSFRVRRVVDETPLSAMLAIDVAVEGVDVSGRLADTHPENAAELARVTADSGMGVLWEQPASYTYPLRYSQAKTRTWDAYTHSWGEISEAVTWDVLSDTLIWDAFDSDSLPVPNRPPEYTLDPAVVHADLVFEQTVSDLARTVTVSYGQPDSVEEQPVPVQAGDGRAPTKSFSTILQEVGDATQYAETMRTRFQAPLWRLSSMKIQADYLDSGEYQTLRGVLQVGTRLTVPIPEGSPVGSMWQGYLEGWSQSFHGNGDGRSTVVDMTVSDRYLTEPADRWLSLSSSGVWSQLPDDLLWEDSNDISNS